MSVLTSLIARGATPIMAKVMVGVIVAVLLSGVGSGVWMALKLGKANAALAIANGEIATLVADQERMKANNRILRGTIEEQKDALKTQAEEFHKYIRRHAIANEVYEKVRAKAANEEQKRRRFEEKLKHILENSDDELYEVLTNPLPDRIINLYNLRLRNFEESVLRP